VPYEEKSDKKKKIALGKSLARGDECLGKKHRSQKRWRKGGKGYILQRGRGGEKGLAITPAGHLGGEKNARGLRMDEHPLKRLGKNLA